MAMKDNFLREVKIGNRVELMIGPKEMEGIVVALDLDTVRIRRDNGKEPVLSLDSISYYELSEDEPEPQTITEAITTVIKEVVQEEKRPEKKVESSEPQKLEVQKTKNNQDVFSLLESRGDTFFQNANSPVVRNYMDVAKSEKSQLSGEFLSIANSLDYAIKQNHEISPADYKIQENVKKLNRIIKADKRNKVAASMLGALYYQCKSDRLALETYKEGDDNESAFAIAEDINSKDYMELFACRHLIDDSELNPYILKWLILRLIETDDYSIVSKINAAKVTPSKLQGYLAFIRAVLLANGIEYNSMLDYDNTKESLSELIHIFMKEDIGSGTRMVEHIPEIKEPVLPVEKPASECP